ncbi:InlB B-repeat-containing protein [Mesotoga sp. BH458_6_3_2_1]|uniref:InlB B-repeat-containing protein n=1 Tax=Mesotoga sp. BH458_6_3_2_1 TaxID=1437446 RepID=UPI000EF25B2D|nr:cadherin-like beta sandwich domain-containing protein [Mesotoga sp. BH458_6_3_2_1]RLL81716.1 hypothetical protein Y697_13400 [Mesotoga sp. BH458_6_3_2_1]
MKKTFILLLLVGMSFLFTSCFVKNSMICLTSEPVDSVEFHIDGAKQHTPFSAIVKERQRVSLEIEEVQMHDLNLQIEGYDAEYYFVSWSDNSTETSRTIEIKKGEPTEIGIEISASFKVAAFAITEGSTFTQEFYTEWHQYGEEILISAPELSGMEFSHWSVELSDRFLPAECTPSIRIGVYSPVLLHAIYITKKTVKINTLPNPADGGITSGDGIYSEGESVTIAATPSDGYRFVNWTLEDVPVSEEKYFTFEATEDATYIANFTHKIYTITASHTEGGTISPSGVVLVTHGASQTFLIQPEEDYFISDVLVDSDSAGPRDTYIFENITSNHTIRAIFSQTPVVTYSVKFIVSDKAGLLENASVTFNGETISTDANGEALFAGVAQGKSKPYSVSRTGYVSAQGTIDIENEDKTVEVKLNRQKYSVSLSASPQNAGALSGEGVYEYGDSVTVVATPNEGWNFINWTENGGQVSNSAVFSFIIGSDRDLVANFSKTSYTIVATAGSGGSISPSGNVVVEHGASKSFTITPDSGYEIDDVLVDGSSIGKVSSYTFNNVTSNHTIEATFKKKTYTIVATAGSGGSISPSGNVVVEHGASKSFTITPDSGYFISDVLVDGESIGPKTGYTFQNITSSHTIHALFEETPPPVFNVTFVVSSESAPVSGATVSFNGEQLATGIDGTVTFTGVIPGNDKPYTVSKTGYQSKSGFVDVIDRDVTVNVELSRGSYTIVATAGSGGSISPSGNVVVEHGSSKSFTITPDSGCEIDDVLVDGSSVGKVSSYTFDSVTSDHTIEAAFKKKTYTIVATAGSGGSISPSGNVVVEHGASESFTITPDSGYEIDDVFVDGSSVGKVSSYTFGNVTSDHNISALFGRILSNDADLEDLVVSPGLLNPIFNKDIETYNVNVSHDTTELTITATLSDTKASMTINEEVAESGTGKTITLNAAGQSTTITIEVTAEDGTKKTYTITVNRAPVPGDGTLIIKSETVASGTYVWITVAARDLPAIKGMTIVLEFDPDFFVKEPQYTVQYLTPIKESGPVTVWSDKIPDNEYLLDLNFGLKTAASVVEETEILRIMMETKPVSGSTALSFAEYTATTGVHVKTVVLDGDIKPIENISLIDGNIVVQ